MRSLILAAVALVLASCSALLGVDFDDAEPRDEVGGPDGGRRVREPNATGACGHGWVDCDDNAQNGCETDTSNDPEHCGGCGYACRPVVGAESATCQESTCVQTCPPGSRAGEGSCLPYPDDPRVEPAFTECIDVGPNPITCAEICAQDGQARCSARCEINADTLTAGIGYFKNGPARCDVESTKDNPRGACIIVHDCKGAASCNEPVNAPGGYSMYYGEVTRVRCCCERSM